jgi:hypothetical protein
VSGLAVLDVGQAAARIVAVDLVVVAFQGLGGKSSQRVVSDSKNIKRNYLVFSSRLISLSTALSILSSKGKTAMPAQIPSTQTIPKPTFANLIVEFFMLLVASSSLWFF